MISGFWSFDLFNVFKLAVVSVLLLVMELAIAFVVVVVFLFYAFV